MAFLVHSVDPLHHSCTIEGEDFHHLHRVLRKAVGDQVDILSVEGVRYCGHIASMNRESALIHLSEPRPHQTESSLDLTIACAAIKGDGFFDNVRMFCELGLQGILVFTSRNTVVNYDDKRDQRKQEKMQRIVDESRKQNLRVRSPRIFGLTAFQDLLHGPRWQNHQKILCYEQATNPIGELKLDPHRPILLLIGPEGGFTQQEADDAAASGVHLISLGPRILKAGTAQIVAATLLQHRFGDIP